MESNAWCPRLTAAMILLGSAVHVKGFGFSLGSIPLKCWQSWPDANCRVTYASIDVGRGLPRVEGFKATGTDGAGGAATGWNGKAITGCGMYGNKTLQSTWRPEALHHPFSFAKWQMTVLGAVVETLVGPMIKARRDLALGRPLGAQLVRECPTSAPLRQIWFN